MSTSSFSKRQITSNLLWSVAGKIVTLAGSLLVGIVVARYLGPEQYGLMNYVISFVALFQTVAIFGLDNIEIREEAKRPDDAHRIVGTAFVLRLLLGVLTAAICIVTAYFMESDPYTIFIIAIYSFTIILLAFNVIRNYFMAIVENEYVVKSEISRTLIGMAFKFGLYFAGAGLTWFLVACTVDYVLLASGYVVSYRTKKGSMRDWTFDKGECLYLLKEAFPLLLTSAAVMVYQRIDQVMIGRMIDKEAVGYFATASRIVEILIYVPMILAQTISPVLTNIRTKSEEEYRQKAQLFMDASVWGTLAIAILCSLCSYWGILLLFGRAYLPAVIVLQIMSFKAVSVALSNTAGNLLIIEGLQRWAIFRDVFGCAVCVVLNYIFLPRYGIIAAAVVAIVTNVAAGYIADLFIPSYRHLFRMQTKALVLGWRNVAKARHMLK